MAPRKLTNAGTLFFLRQHNIDFSITNPGSYKIHHPNATYHMMFYPKNLKIVFSGLSKIQVVTCSDIEEVAEMLKRGTPDE